MLVTGNTIVDAVQHYLPIAREKRSVTSFSLDPQKYFLATVHRAENTDFPEVLQQIFVGLKEVSRTYDQTIVFPIHPRTRGRIKEFGISIPECIRLMEPVGFYDFLVLESDASLVFTDSGGVQEECCILQVPCVTLRDDTERPETVAAGGNILAGRVSTELLKNTNDMLSRARDWANPFGDGKAASRIIDFLLESSLN
jgi:UDP-N-acetylglucosamine 2-epimerase (non-hydrolysing)